MSNASKMVKNRIVHIARSKNPDHNYNKQSVLKFLSESRN